MAGGLERCLNGVWDCRMFVLCLVNRMFEWWVIGEMFNCWLDWCDI